AVSLEEEHSFSVVSASHTRTLLSCPIASRRLSAEQAAVSVPRKLLRPRPIVLRSVRVATSHRYSRLPLMKDGPRLSAEAQDSSSLFRPGPFHQAPLEQVERPVDALPGEAEARGDLGHGIALQAQGEHLAVLRRQPAQQAFDLIDQDRGLVRAGLARE